MHSLFYQNTNNFQSPPCVNNATSGSILIGAAPVCPSCSTDIFQSWLNSKQRILVKDSNKKTTNPMILSQMFFNQSYLTRNILKNWQQSLECSWMLNHFQKSDVAHEHRNLKRHDIWEVGTDIRLIFSVEKPRLFRVQEAKPMTFFLDTRQLHPPSALTNLMTQFSNPKTHLVCL